MSGGETKYKGAGLSNGRVVGVSFSRGSRVEGVYHSGQRYMMLQFTPPVVVPAAGMEVFRRAEQCSIALTRI